MIDRREFVTGLAAVAVVPAIPARPEWPSPFSRATAARWWWGYYSVELESEVDAFMSGSLWRFEPGALYVIRNLHTGLAFRRFEPSGGALRYHGRHPDIELAALSWRDFSVAARAAWLALAELRDINPAPDVDTITAPIVFRIPQNYTYPVAPIIV